MRISDWSSDVCSSDLLKIDTREASVKFPFGQGESQGLVGSYNINENGVLTDGTVRAQSAEVISFVDVSKIKSDNPQFGIDWDNDTNFRESIMADYSSSKMGREVENNDVRSEEHTYESQS